MTTAAPTDASVQVSAKGCRVFHTGGAGSFPFCPVVEQFEVEQWQVTEPSMPGELRLLVVPHGPGLDAGALSRHLEADLASTATGCG